MDRNEKGQFLPGTHWREDKAFRHREWLDEEYRILGRSSGDIAKQFGVTDNAILFWLHKHSIPRRSVAEARAIKHWGASGEDNPMWNRRGELNPRWLGGVTPERQAFYTSRAWKKACAEVWKRDDATCQRCGLRKTEQSDMPFHIHHIVSFAASDLRARPSNLVLLCEVCHHFVHSNENVDEEFLSEI